MAENFAITSLAWQRTIYTEASCKEVLRILADSVLNLTSFFATGSVMVATEGLPSPEPYED